MTMRLDLNVFPVSKILFDGPARLDADHLFVDPDRVRALVLEDPRIADVQVEVAEPGQSVRIIHVCDAFEPRLKVAGPGVCYPGVMGPVDTVGHGVTHCLRGMSVLLSCEYPRLIETGIAAAPEAILDMSGPGALSPLSQTLNLVLVLKLAPGYSQGDYGQAVQRAGLKVSHHLAELTRNRPPSHTERYELVPVAQSLPRVVYIHQMYTHLNIPSPYVTWYGMPITDWMPMWVHPNEILDGALLSGVVGKDAVRPTSWEHVNHPIIKRLYAAHGTEVDFAGVILHRTRFEVFEEKQLSANQATKLAQLIGATGALITWVGAGNAFIEGMLTVQALERAGIKSVFMTYEHGGREGAESPLMFTVPEADAIVSVGSLDRPKVLPPVARVIGGETLNLNPEAGDERIPAAGEIALDWHLPVLSGTDNWGFGCQTCVEY